MEGKAFAQVLFHTLWNKFKVPSDENYILKDVEFDLPEDIIKAIVSLQLCFRFKLEPFFLKNPALILDGDKFFSFVDDLLDSIAKGDSPFYRTLGSCVIFAEFALYKYTEGNKQYLKSAPKFWPRYFDERLKPSFDNGGGFEELKVKAGEVNAIYKGLDKYLSLLKQPYDFSQLVGFNERLQEYREAVLSSLQQFDALVNLEKEARVPPLPELPTPRVPPLPELPTPRVPPISPESSTSSLTSSKSGGMGGARTKVRSPSGATVQTKLSAELMSPRKISKRATKSSSTDKLAIPIGIPKEATSGKEIHQTLVNPESEEFAKSGATTTRVTRSSARRQAQVAKSETSVETKGDLQVPEQTRLTRLAEKLESSHLQHTELETEVPPTACDEPASSEVTESAEKESTDKTGRGCRKGKKRSKKSKK